MSKIDLVSFWYASGSVGMAPYVNTTLDGGHIDYEGVSSKVDLNSRIQSIMSSLPDFFDSYTIKLTDVNLSGILVSKAECVLKSSGSSSSPDYTQVLTNINTNLTNLNSNLSYTVSGGSVISLSDILVNIFNCFSNVGISSLPVNIRNNSFIKSLDDKFKYSTDSTNVATTLLKILSCFSSSFANNETVFQSNSGSYFKAVQDCLKQSVSPNANITDVISALNTTINSKQDTIIVNNDNTNLIQVEGVLDYRLKPQDSM